jgi:hypothetical protein
MKWKIRNPIPNFYFNNFQNRFQTSFAITETSPDWRTASLTTTKIFQSPTCLDIQDPAPAFKWLDEDRHKNVQSSKIRIFKIYLKKSIFTK